MTNLNITLDRGKKKTLQAQLIQQLKQLIRDHKIGKNQRLPSSRALAQGLQVSRIVTLAAYEQLIAEGYLHSRPGAGTYSALDAPPPPVTEPAYSGPAWFRPPEAPQADSPVDFDFSLGRPAVAKFDEAAWKRAWRQALAVPFQNHQPPPEGYLPLRQAIATHVTRNRGIHCRAEDVVITTGAADVINLLARVTAPFHPLSCLENPAFTAAVHSFTRYGHEILPIAIDHHGLDVRHLPETPGRAKLLFCTPSHQFPLGFRLSLERRHQVIDWARRQDALILEDDYDSEFRYDVAPLPPLKELDRSGRVLYFSSLSKSLSPAIRLGYMIAPDSIRQAVIQEINQNHMQPTWLLQQAMAHFIERGELDKHIRRTRRHYAKLHHALKEVLSHMPPSVKIHGLEAGLHCFLEVPPHDERLLQRHLRAQKLKIVRLDSYFHAPSPWRGYAVGFSHLTVSEIQQGLKVLVAIFHDILA